MKGHKLKVETHQKETFLRYLQYFDGLSNKLEHSQRDYSSITGFSYVEQNWQKLRFLHFVVDIIRRYAPNAHYFQHVTYSYKQRGTV